MIAFLASQGLPAGTMIDGWKVLESLGAGGFGAVQKVEKNGRLHALKIALLPEGTPDEKKTHARTLRELLCLLLLDHPNIVRVVAHGRWPDEHGGHLYLVLEYVEGWTLAQWIERTHPTVHEIIRVFVNIAAAVAYMHARGVFHRDLKLINVLIRKSDSEPVIIDFGASDFAQAPDLTDAGLPPGTDRFRAPEANRWWFANRKKPKARYDFRVTDELFAFGVMLYDALTDPRPTEDRDRSAVNNVLAPARDPQARNPRIPDALASVVRRLLARNPADRPESFEAVRRELEELLEHQGAEYRIPAHSPSAQVEHVAEAASGAELREVAPVKVRLRSRRRLLVSGAVGVSALVAITTYARLGQGFFGEPPPETARQVVRAQPEKTVGTAPPAQSPGPLNPESPPVSAPPRPEPSSTVRTSIQEEGSNVTTKNPSASSTMGKAKKLRFANEAEFLAWCRSAAIIGTLAAANAGCPGAQVKPDPAPCPDDAQKAMFEKLGLRPRGEVELTIDLRQSGEPDEFGTYKDGPVVGRVEESPFNTAKIPPGALLFGNLWTQGDEVIGRYDRLQLPGGKEFPVCFVLGEEGRAEKLEGSKPGEAVLPRRLPAYVVARWR